MHIVWMLMDGVVVYQFAPCGFVPLTSALKISVRIISPWSIISLVFTINQSRNHKLLLTKLSRSLRQTRHIKEQIIIGAAARSGFRPVGLIAPS